MPLFRVLLGVHLRVVVFYTCFMRLFSLVLFSLVAVRVCF